MKRDWVRKDEDFSGKGARDYHRKCEFNRIVKLVAEYRKCLRKYENIQSISSQDLKKKQKTK
jgi:hypothetical protein